MEIKRQLAVAITPFQIVELALLWRFSPKNPEASACAQASQAALSGTLACFSIKSRWHAGKAVEKLYNGSPFIKKIGIAETPIK
ncbi:MAG: hypothetical protein FWG10_02375 [Eubacteriaceae bacterium]|nr:hypothetical protein [Eubacteriaceae bacterium]